MLIVVLNSAAYETGLDLGEKGEKKSIQIYNMERREVELQVSFDGNSFGRIESQFKHVQHKITPLTQLFNRISYNIILLFAQKDRLLLNNAITMPKEISNSHSSPFPHLTFLISLKSYAQYRIILHITRISLLYVLILIFTIGLFFLSPGSVQSQMLCQAVFLRVWS